MIFDRLQELYCVRSDLGNLLKALGRLDEAKVGQFADNPNVRCRDVRQCACVPVVWLCACVGAAGDNVVVHRTTVDVLFFCFPWDTRENRF